METMAKIGRGVDKVGVRDSATLNFRAEGLEVRVNISFRSQWLRLGGRCPADRNSEENKDLKGGRREKRNTNLRLNTRKQVCHLKWSQLGGNEHGYFFFVFFFILCAVIFN